MNIKLERPHIGATATDTEWVLFQAKWERYSLASSLSDEGLINQFWACIEEKTQTELVHKGFTHEKSVDVLVNEVKKLVLETRNNLVHRFEFTNMEQHKDETVNRYVARLKGKAELSPSQI